MRRIEQPSGGEERLGRESVRARFPSCMMRIEKTSGGGGTLKARSSPILSETSRGEVPALRARSQLELHPYAFTCQGRAGKNSHLVRKLGDMNSMGADIVEVCNYVHD